MNEKSVGLSHYLKNSNSDITISTMDMLSSTLENCTVDNQKTSFSTSNEESILSSDSEDRTNDPFLFPMSVPNPKRSVPVNFLHIINEDSYDLEPVDYNFGISQSVQNSYENYSFTGKVNDIHPSSLNTISHQNVGQIQPFLTSDQQWDTSYSKIQNDMEFNSNCSVNVINRKVVGTIGRPKSTPIHPSNQRFGGLFNSTDSTIRPRFSVANFNTTEHIYEDYPYRDNTTEHIYQNTNDDNINIFTSNNTGRTHFNQQNMYMNKPLNSTNSKDSSQQPQYNNVNSNNEIIFRSSNINGRNPSTYHHCHNNELMGTILRVQGGTASAPPLRHYKESIHNIPLDTSPILHYKDHHHSSSRSSSSSIVNVEQDSIEDTVLRTCREILCEAAGNSLKAVELANTLRARVGIEILAQIREKWGGLLSLLERGVASNSGVSVAYSSSNIDGQTGGCEYEEMPHFRVDRIPKSDQVTLITTPTISAMKLPLNNNTINNNISNSSNVNQETSSRIFYENNEHEFHSNSFQAATATRCLHVGNVPSNLSEIQLMQEFEKFGQLDGLKLVLQRNGSRRFAFVTFRTIEQAITAKHCLSKQHPWKSVIAFARKEFSHQHKVNQHNTYASAAYNNSNIINSSSSSSYKDGITKNLQNERNFLTDHLEYQLLQNNAYGYSPTTTLQNRLKTNSNISSQNMISPSSSILPLNTQGGYLIMDNSSGVNHVLQQQQQQQQRSCKVLQRLCDDTYVPTQPWPIDIDQDLYYCQAVIAQLQQFGGYCTISKLRGFLRHRIAAVDNIKSVPLKAMLSAYPQYFLLESNHISLVSNTYNFPYSNMMC